MLWKPSSSSTTTGARGMEERKADVERVLQNSKASVAHAPRISPSFCFSTTYFRDFLRSARVLDDTLASQLNALALPLPFDAQTSSRRTTKTVGDETCRVFVRDVLRPSWQVRSEVLAYCQGVAQDMQSDTVVLKKAANLRRDPYSGRDETIEGKRDPLLRMIGYERSVEEIIRDRSWEILRAKCVNSQFPPDWR